jgi:hypothetical protein
MKALVKTFARNRKCQDALDIILLLAIVSAGSSPLIFWR